MTVSATDDPVKVIISENGIVGDAGTNGTDGAGFNQVRKALIDNPISSLYGKNHLVRVLKNLLTVNRATIGTYVDIYGIVQTASDGTPREEKEGWLIEGASTNLALRSEEFDDAVWTKSSVVITPDTAIAPDGTMNADRYLGSAGAHNMTDSVTYVGTEATISVYAKSNGGGADTFRMILNSAGGTSGAFTATSEWKRFTFTLAGLTAGANTIGIISDSSSNATDILIWGLQVEELPFTSSYIKTTTVSVTRAAEIHTFQVQDNIPKLDDGFTIVFRTGDYNEESASQEIIVIPATVGDLFRLGTDSSGNWVSILQGSDTIQYSATTVINATSSSDQTVIITYVSSTGVMNIHINDTLAGTATLATGITATIDLFETVVTIDGDFDINIEGLRVYDFVLNSEEITYLN